MHNTNNSNTFPRQSTIEIIENNSAILAAPYLYPILYKQWRRREDVRLHFPQVILSEITEMLQHDLDEYKTLISHIEKKLCPTKAGPSIKERLQTLLQDYPLLTGIFEENKHKLEELNGLWTTFKEDQPYIALPKAKGALPAVPKPIALASQQLLSISLSQTSSSPAPAISSSSSSATPVSRHSRLAAVRAKRIENRISISIKDMTQEERYPTGFIFPFRNISNEATIATLREMYSDINNCDGARFFAGKKPIEDENTKLTDLDSTQLVLKKATITVKALN